MSSDDEIQFVSENKEASNNPNKNSKKYFQEEKFKTFKEEEESDSDVEEINTTNESQSTTNKEKDTTNEILTDSDEDKNEQASDKEEDGDDENTNNIPSGAECLKRCKDFAEVTGTDTALAMFYLQDTKWDLEKGLNRYFKATGKNQGNKIVACFDVKKLDEDEERQNAKLAKKPKTSKQDSPEQIVTIDENEQEEKKSGSETEKPKHFKILSWNIDGLDNGSREARTIGVANKIKKEEPDVVMLQEVIQTTEEILRSNLSNQYDFFSGKYQSEYYTMILVSKKTCVSSNKNLINFENSTMGRNLLKVKLNYKKMIDICVMTSHLESTADFTKPRIEQLRKCFNEIKSQEEKCLVFFGGDLNLRDSELSAIGGLPKGVCDLWEATGSRKECQFTWDLTRNTNLTWNQKFKPRCRFDRLFFRPNSKGSSQIVNDKPVTLMPVYFELEGLEKLKTCSRFCSDHWAIQAYCQIEAI